MNGGDQEVQRYQKDKEQLEDSNKDAEDRLSKMRACYQERKGVLEKLKREIIFSQLAIKDLKGGSDKDCESDSVGTSMSIDNQNCRKTDQK